MNNKTLFSYFLICLIGVAVLSIALLEESFKANPEPEQKETSFGAITISVSTLSEKAECPDHPRITDRAELKRELSSPEGSRLLKNPFTKRALELTNIVK